MTTFDDREKSFENKHAHDEELRFKINARRNKLLGLWAAELLHLGKEEAEAFAREVVMADFKEPGDEDVLTKVLGSLSRAGIQKSDAEIRAQMNQLLAVAREQIMKG